MLPCRSAAMPSGCGAPAGNVAKRSTSPRSQAPALNDSKMKAAKSALRTQSLVIPPPQEELSRSVCSGGAAAVKSRTPESTTPRLYSINLKKNLGPRFRGGDTSAFALFTAGDEQRENQRGHAALNRVVA